MTLDLRDVPFRTAVATLLTKMGVRFAIEPTTTNIPVTLRMTDVEFSTALRNLLRLGGATYRREGGDTYIIGPRLALPEDAVARPADEKM